MDIEKVINCLNDIEQIMIVRQEICPREELQYWIELQEGVADALALLKEQERKKGSWDYGTQCSVCKGTIIPPKDRKIRVNFCPWCGADMRGEYDE